MKNLLLIFSVAANLVLAGWWLRPAPASASRAGQPASIVSAGPSRAGAGLRVAGESTGASAPGPAAAAATGVTSWQDVQSEDLKEWIRRLRSVGCPEETVRDLVLAEVNRRFSARSAELWPDRFKVKPFWETENRQDAAEQKKNRDRSRQERALQNEKSTLLVDLLGVDPEKERRKAEGGEDFPDYTQRRVSFLPESKREAAAKYLDEFEDKMQDFYARNRGLFDAQYRAEQRELEAERLRGLSQFLTPEELREYELRQSQLANQLSHDLRNLSLTREQYEAIFDIRKKYGDSIYNYGDLEGKPARDRVEEAKNGLKGDLANSLGPDFAREYERSQDYSYQELIRLARRSDLPADTASKVYQMKESAEQSVKQLQASQDLSPDKRREALQQIRSETENAVKTALGEENYKKYLRQGGWWINNLAAASRGK